jgi:hypothetical protein
MTNINNKNLISFVFTLLTITAFAIGLAPKNASADMDNCFKVNYNGWYGYNCSYNLSNTNNNNGYNNNTINPVPFVSSLNPSSAIINSNTTITVSGNNFVSGSIVKWNGSDRATTFVNSQTLRAQLNYSDLSTKGNYLISVSNPIPGGGFSNTLSFTVNSAPVYYGNTTNKTSTNTVNRNSNTTVNKNANTTGTTTSPTLQQESDLAAGALFGSNAFLPSSIFQWIFFFILILLAIVLWRKLYVNEEDKHHSTLKHA